jgi:hypothetical protein
MRSTITKITDEDVIHCFQNDLSSKNIYHDFGRNHPKTIVDLRDMMQRWANQEDEENERFRKRTRSPIKGHDKDEEEGDKSGPRDTRIPRTLSMLSSAAMAASNQAQVEAYSARDLIC